MLEHIFYLLICFHKLEWAQFVQLPVHLGRIIFQFNLELVPLPNRWKSGWQELWENIILFLSTALISSSKSSLHKWTALTSDFPLYFSAIFSFLTIGRNPRKALSTCFLFSNRLIYFALIILTRCADVSSPSFANGSEIQSWRYCTTTIDQVQLMWGFSFINQRIPKIICCYGVLVCMVEYSVLVASIFNFRTMGQWEH